MRETERSKRTISPGTQVFFKSREAGSASLFPLMASGSGGTDTRQHAKRRRLETRWLGRFMGNSSDPQLRSMTKSSLARTRGLIPAHPASATVKNSAAILLSPGNRLLILLCDVCECAVIASAPNLVVPNSVCGPKSQDRDGDDGKFCRPAGERKRSEKRFNHWRAPV